MQEVKAGSGESTTLPSPSGSNRGSDPVDHSHKPVQIDPLLEEQQQDFKRLLSMFGIDLLSSENEDGTRRNLDIKDAIEMLRPAAEKFHRCRSLAREAHALKLIERLACTLCICYFDVCYDLHYFSL